MKYRRWIRLVIPAVDPVDLVLWIVGGAWILWQLLM